MEGVLFLNARLLRSDDFMSTQANSGSAYSRLKEALKFNCSYINIKSQEISCAEAIV
jgi:hypothetical protein